MAAGQDKKNIELFLLACARGLEGDALHFITEGVAVGATDRRRRTGAHFAAAHGELGVLQLLHERGADLDADDDSGRSPLHYAAAADHEQAVQWLLAKGVWVDSMDENDCTALHLAAAAGAAHAAARLVRSKAKWGLLNKWRLDALGEAICANDPKTCNAMHNAGLPARPGAGAGAAGFSLLHVAAALGCADSVAWLLKHGWQTSVRPDGAPPLLHCAVIGGSVGVTEQLVAAGASRESRDEQGTTVRQFALQQCTDSPNTRKLLGVLGVTDRAAAAAPERAGTPGGAQRRLPSPAERVAAAPATRATTPAAARAADRIPAYSPSERLAHARTPEEVGEVMRRLPLHHARARVSTWMKLAPAELDALETITTEAKAQIAWARSLKDSLARLKATEWLRRDEDFQADMHDTRIRGLVDSIIANPERGPAVVKSHPRVLECLDKLRRLRDVFRLHGDTAIDLKEATTQWRPEDEKRKRDMQAALEDAIEKSIAILCLEETSGACGAFVGGGGIGKPGDRPFWQRMAMWLLQQLAVLALAAVMLWWSGRMTPGGSSDTKKAAPTPS